MFMILCQGLGCLWALVGAEDEEIISSKMGKSVDMKDISMELGRIQGEFH